MNASRSCSRCGAVLPEEFCARCLLEIGLQPPIAVDEPAVSAPSMRVVPPTIEELTALFPDLEIESLIGHGGMGAVFRARQKRLDRVVALKVLPRELSENRDFAERFLREARALARLSHPNIVAVHEYGETGGICWLLLEHVDGANLRTILRNGRMESKAALALVCELCEALQYAHDEGVVHRDIKPENVLVDRRGRARLADFGLAKLVGPAQDANLTREGQVMGTPHYMAPEQIERPREVDHRADIYALGVVLYEMLTGSLPRGNFEPPSRRVQVDVRLDEIVLKALEHEPSRRYQHAVDVKTDVDHVGTTPPPKSEPDEGFVFRAEIGREKRSVGPSTPRRDESTEEEPERPNPLHGVRAFFAWSLIWIALAAAWQWGGFAYGIAILVAVSAAHHIVEARLRPERELRVALASHGTRHRLLRNLAAPLLAAAALVLMQFGFVLIWEHSTRDYEAALGGVQLSSVDSGGLWMLLDSSIRDPLGDAALALQRGNSTHIDYPHGFVTNDPRVCFGLALACVAFALAFRLHAGAGRHVQRRAWVVFASVLGTAMLGLGALITAMSLRGYADSAHERRDLVTRCEAARPIEEVTKQVRPVFYAHEYRVYAEADFRIARVHGGEPVARVRRLRLHKNDAAERWELTTAGPRRESPDMLLTLVSAIDSQRTFATIEAGSIDANSPHLEAMRREVEELARELAAGR